MPNRRAKRFSLINEKSSFKAVKRMGLYANTSYGELYMFKKMVSNNKDNSSIFSLDVDSRQ